MTVAEPFDAWLQELAYLTIEQTLDLPAWLQTVAFVSQFAFVHLNDGAGALFYNEPEKIHPVATALAAIGEPELSTMVRRIFEVLSPTLEHEVRKVHEVLLQEPLATLVKELDQHIERRWLGFHDKLKALAEANGWQEASRGR